MNKNVVIGALAVVVIAGLGIYFANSNNGAVAPTDNTTVNVTTTPPAVVRSNPTLEPDAPVVQTGQDNSAYISTAVLTGNVTPNGASTTYWFSYGESTAFTTETVAQAIGSGYYSTPTPGYISGLKSNTLYYYRLSAKNRFATVTGATYSFKTNGTPPPTVIKTTVRTSSATDITRDTATLNGQVNPNGVPTNYWYEYGTDTNFGSVTGYQATNSGTTFMSVPASISGLDPITKYYFRLNAQNQFGTVTGSTSNFTTAGPAAATKPIAETSGATGIGQTDATFVGHVNANGADTTYWFEYSTDSLLGSLVGSGTPKSTVTGTTLRAVQINVNGLERNTKYYYHLVATNSYGTSTGSIVSFTTKK